MAQSIQVIANGERYDIPAGCSLSKFVEERGLALGRVVVERNGQPLTPSEARHTNLEAGDRLEIVRIVAGG